MASEPRIENDLEADLHTEHQILNMGPSHPATHGTAKFVTEQVNVTRDEAGAAIEGDPNRVATVTDLWTFSRNTRSGNPNWLLVATASPQ